MCNFPSEGSCNLFRGSHRVPALLRVQSGATALGLVCPDALEDMGNLNFDQSLRTALETLHSWSTYFEMEKESGSLPSWNQREWEVIKSKLTTAKRCSHRISVFTVHIYCNGSDSKIKLSHKKQTKQTSELKNIYILYFYSLLFHNQEKNEQKHHRFISKINTGIYCYFISFTSIGCWKINSQFTLGF